jgi:hypothetical protein
MPGSMVGVNPDYNPDLFRSPERADKAYGYFGLLDAQSRKKGLQPLATTLNISVEADPRRRASFG